MNPNAKIITQGYAHAQRMLQIEGTDETELSNAMVSLREVLVKTSDITWESLFDGKQESASFESSSEALEGDEILTRLTDVRLIGLDILDEMRDQMLDAESGFKFDTFKDRVSKVSDKLLTVGKQTHELTKGMEVQLENDKTPNM